jgi:hypothetical protein
MEEPKPPPPPVVVPPPPADIDLAALQKDLGCDKSAHKHACGVLKEFSKAQRFALHTPSGQGHWAGRAHLVENGEDAQRVLILWAKVVPLSQVGPGDLAIKAGFDFIPDEYKPQTEKMLRTLSTNHDPRYSNNAFRYVDAYVPEPTKQWVMVNTAGPSVHLTAEATVYLRFTPPRTVWLVNPARGASKPGDGMYAELWTATW